MTRRRRLATLVAFAAVSMCACSLEPEGELVHIVGTRPSKVTSVTLRAFPASGPVGVTFVDVDPAASGPFEITAHVEPRLCDVLEVYGTSCKCGLFGDGTVRRTKSVALGSCGEHVVTLEF